MINTVSGNKIKLLRRKGIYITNYLELKVSCNCQLNKFTKYDVTIQSEAL